LSSEAPKVHVFKLAVTIHLNLRVPKFPEAEIHLNLEAEKCSRAMIHLSRWHESDRTFEMDLNPRTASTLRAVVRRPAKFTRVGIRVEVELNSGPKVSKG
jgi:hypothetical protein